MADAQLQRCSSAREIQQLSSSPSRARCRLLARGASCPQPGHQQQLTVQHLEIVRTLACGNTCFVSIVKVPDVSSNANRLAIGTPPSWREPAAAGAVPTTSSAVACSSAPSYKQGVAKSYRKAKLDEDETRQVELEIKLHMQLSALSLHVVPFWAALDNHDSTTIVTEHCEGDLRSVLEQAGGALSESAVRAQVAAPLLEVLVHMHRLGFVHRDIKPENVFVSGKHSMLGDFGLAIALPSAATGDSNISGISSSPRCCSSSLTAGSDSSSASVSMPVPLLRPCASSSSVSTIPAATSGTAGNSGISSTAGSSSRQLNGVGVTVNRHRSSCGIVVFDCSVMPQLKQLQAGGTPAYVAPEVVQATFNNTSLEVAVGPQNDVWNLGVLVWETLAGRHPFGDHTSSPGAFMCAVFSRSQSQIATGVAALPVSDACKDWLGLALQKDPVKRGTAAALQQHSWLLSCAPVEAQQQQQQPANVQQQRVELAQAAKLLQRCTSNDFPAAAAEAAAAAAAPMGTYYSHSALSNSSSSFTTGSCSTVVIQQGPLQVSSHWQTAAAAAAAACGMQSATPCSTATVRLASDGGSCSAFGGISGLSQQQFASYLQTKGSFED